ncbi:MAG TPA: DNA-formamidopyrimidine glycosylase family protein [Acidimicrobiales bacterium]|nr:DNA-formamidopyrimidine glycosylase family protein [Acidimicrobiales bacterium]
MPELPEVESYRRLAEAGALERTIASVRAPDAWYLKRGTDAEALTAVLAGHRFVAARRRGKLMMLDTDDGIVIGLRFGMSGRLLVDGHAGVDRLQYGRAAAEARFERFAVGFADGGSMAMSDPRRLGGVELDPDLSLLGPDAAVVTLAQLRSALAGSQVALKARLLDQRRIAGVGNLIADEVLWRAGLSPVRAAGGLSEAEMRRLRRHLVAGVSDLMERGGSHTGDLGTERRRGGACPLDGAALARATVGGRTSYWCPDHQR